MSNIRLSEKYGLNPSLVLCPLCGESTSIALNGRLKDDVKAPRQCIDRSPCDKCKNDLDSYKAQGFLLLIVHDEYEKQNKDVSPWQYFTRLSVLKADAAERIFVGLDMSHGAAWIPESIAKKIGV